MPQIKNARTKAGIFATADAGYYLDFLTALAVALVAAAMLLWVISVTCWAALRMLSKAELAAAMAL
jgi:hypothetical protein